LKTLSFSLGAAGTDIPLQSEKIMMCRELLKTLQIEETFGVTRLEIGDDSWLYLNYSHAHMWSVADDKRPVRVD
jgi:hypothetical protein